MHPSSSKLSTVALLFSDECALPVRKVILEEAVVVEVIRVEFSVALAKQVDYFSAVEGAIGHGRKFVLGEILAVIVSQLGDLVGKACLLQVLHEVIRVQSVELPLL
jgi:hypothetical protein